MRRGQVRPLQSNGEIFHDEITIKGDRLSSRESTGLEIYGRSIDHTDTSELVRQQ